MSISLTERARQNRLIALRALTIRKLSADGGVVMLHGTTSREPSDAVFSSRRSNPMSTMFMAA